MQESGNLGSHALEKEKWKIKAFREGQNYTARHVHVMICHIIILFLLCSFKPVHSFWCIRHGGGGGGGCDLIET